MKYSLLAHIALLSATAVSLAADPPKMLIQDGGSADPTAASGSRSSYAIMRMPDGSFAFYDRYHPQAGPLVLPDRDGQKHTLLPYLPAEIVNSEVIAKSGVLSNTQVILTKDNHVKSVYVKGEPLLDKETAARVGLPRYLNVWITQASPTAALAPKMIWQGYNGSQMEYEQMLDGRIIVPYGSFQPHAKGVPPNGRHKTIIQFSDDGGRTWTESESTLISPCYAGYNGSNEGACEPAIEQLNNGRIWMLMRTQAGFLYESYSADNGTTWQPAAASRFSASHGPPNIMRHKNGWLVVCWNNCELPPREAGQGVYGGRDALHMAVSDDDGKTWRGFREIYLDHRRNDNPAKTGDRGTAYPLGAYTADGKMVVLAGQGEEGRNPILVDPEWIVETEATADFSDGLKQWSVYKPHGPAKGWWRARTVGAELVASPTDSAAKVLHVGRPDELPADGAVWNFPNGWKGSLTARVMLRKGSRGGTICLNDRMFDPSNSYGEEFSVFKADFGGNGRIGDATLSADQWHDVKLEWDLTVAECRVLVDGKPAGALKLRHPTLNGISYVRFRSAATDVDTAGFLIGSVKASITDPYAPPRSVDDQNAHERRYVEKVTPLWTNPS